MGGVDAPKLGAKGFISPLRNERRVAQLSICRKIGFLPDESVRTKQI